MPVAFVVELEQHGTVVIELAAFDNRVEHRTYFRDFRTRDILSEVCSVRAYITDGATRTRLRRVGTPRGLLLARAFEERRQPSPADIRRIPS